MNIAEIGKNAGLVWKTLHQKASPNAANLKKLTGLDDKNLCLALGWLAREGKINFHSEKRSATIDLK
ncbi:winged helix-turn-helix domain-containing protein [candidate division TA06 bacterium]|uniref:Winged helix-turn-helix domain-containing protein n=1 Tax=candidate division TA06 bacterium TaxID=2250710 RepID=A0A933IDC5_UNCT6|nr:winged helix-turn-helix domain-containing protein [candidate division TA06 bacterium]